ncbi:tail fiber protein [Photorhabdus cinerea]|uniref:Phage tail collar domain-containing protein n=1 Tax=Photorhabdus cinerea TaxID=471575 RepID=A0A7X5TFE4_9GAMM|nr:tail fiber protein [Photorhabdus cinerea]NHB91621.1 hypothetical protein [Photorhabdus cinerea]
MKKKHNQPNSESNIEDTNIQSIGPETDKLKDRFKAGSIPLQTDYENLIDIADIGRKATGQAPGQSGKPGNGLSLTNDGALQTAPSSTGGLYFNNNELAIKPSNGINVNDQGISIKLAQDSGLNVGHNGLTVLNDSDSGLLRREGSKSFQVKAGNGINVDNNGVSIKLVNSDSGLYVNNNGLIILNHPDSGLNRRSNDKGLQVKAGNGIKVDNNGVSVKAKTNNNTIKVEPDGISVGIGWGVKSGGEGLDVRASNGISVDKNGVAVKPNTSGGITVDSSGVAVKPKVNGGIQVNSDGVSVKCWEKGGIQVIDSDGIYLKLDGANTSGQNSTSGLSLSDRGVKVNPKADGGIIVDRDGVSIDFNKVLPRGMIVMFHGNSAPAGWAFCDGNNGTPDLRSRFVMCGNNFSDKGNSSKANGSGNGKSFSRNTTSTTVSVNVTVQNTTLTESQIPSHKHIESMPYYISLGMAYGYTPMGKTAYQINNESGSLLWRRPASGDDYHPYTSSTGRGQGHSHQATASSYSHNHSVDVVPPYYLLAFIMKL